MKATAMQRNALQSRTIVGRKGRADRLIRISRGFTLTELLVVIAITAILLGLLFIPIIQGFNITRKAQNETQAQAAARVGLEQITRELSQAAYVYDNTNAPIAIPLAFNVPVGVGGANTTIPHVLYAKIDLVQPTTSGLRPGDTVDPTTGRGMNGSPVRLPLAPGTRVVRYFLGLQKNLEGGAPAVYRNIYEFTRTDSNHNPLILYRAEFDPRDPNLFDLARYDSPLDNEGGFNDPSFFYNTNVAPNGRTYAENWKAASTPVVDGPHQDMLGWRRDDTVDPEVLLPRPLVLFSPATVVGDTATPGFLTAGGAEVPGAVPTLYGTRDAQWVLPYTITVYRGSGGAGASRPSFGTLQLRFENEVQGDGTTRLRVARVDAQGALTTPDDQLFTALSPGTGRLFVKTPNLAFAVDPARGRIETGFPPLAGTANGVPLLNVGGSFSPMAPGGYPSIGELVPTALRMSTRAGDAGALGVPTNQGLTAIAPLALAASGPYFADTNPILPTSYPSPMQVFGNATGGALAPGGGLLISPGTEKVMGPDLSITQSSLSSLVSWHRAPGALASVVKKSTLVDDKLDGNLPARKRWSQIVGQRAYVLDQDTRPNNLMQIVFDEPNGPGLPAKAITDPNSIAEKELYVSYLWQNNYARRVGGAQNGWPVDASDNTLFDLAGGVVQGKQTLTPEPDVIKVDYSTRSQIVVNFGVNVYDTNTRKATTLQLNDRVKVGNLGR